MKYLALKIPGQTGSVEILTPPGIPHEIKLGTLFSLAIEVAMVIGILLSLMYLTYGGIFWIQTKGDKEQLDKARRIITYALVGLILMSFSLVIVNIFIQALGVDSLIHTQ